MEAYKTTLSLNEMTTESFCPKLPAIWRPECTLRVKGHLTVEGRTPFFAQIAEKSTILIIVAISTCLIALLGIVTCCYCCCLEKKDGKMELQTVNVKTRAISPCDDTSSENTERDHIVNGTSRSSGRANLVPSDQANTSDRGG